MAAHGKGDRRPLAPLTLGALGVVYGDIGTSPLYALKEVFAGAHHPVPITTANILGILSLMVWSLVMIVAVKYVMFIMRADNRGEGGIMALMALVLGAQGDRPLARTLMLFGLFGTALFYGDSVITPAISVLSAVEGLEVGNEGLAPFVIPVTLAVLTALFFVQKRGTASVGAWFGPVMVVWFAALAVLGLVNIVQAPRVLAALDPRHIAAFFTANPKLAFLSLGAVVLAVTGAEALYADMGHFGRRPIQIAWFGLVLPALVLNYFGQGALLLQDPKAVDNPFYLLGPDWAVHPLVLLATAATVIASQAVISGAYSIARQATQLGYAPRVHIQHTSREEIGQIYLPGLNWLLFAAVVALVLGFRSSTNLASAYGIAVTGTMAITTILAFAAIDRVTGRHRVLGLCALAVFLCIDVAYLSANFPKIRDGGWFPLVFALVVFTLMTTWKRGRALLRERLEAEAMPLDPFLVGILRDETMARVPGTAVFLTQNPRQVPPALLHSLKHYKSLHERVVVLTVVTASVPHVDPADRVEMESVDERCQIVRVHYGFMDEPNLPAALRGCAQNGLEFDLMETSFFLGRETVIPKLGAGMALWRQKIFLALYRNAGSAVAYFQLPPNRVVELGTQVVL
ncbi:MAG: potassium transporter Kup [Gammaproteobacteria bacterium]|nr:potassium transporter Kup [Gammaproteobacteria bacterium]